MIGKGSCSLALLCVLIGCANDGSREGEARRTHRSNEIRTSSRQIENPGLLSPSQARELVGSRAHDAIEALKNRNMERLSTFIHPDSGVRISPYTYVDKARDIILKAAQVNDMLSDTTHYRWGHFDGSGEPIRLRFSDYLQRFVYDRDFSNAREIGYQRVIGRGNTLNNLKEIYPNGVVVEYHFPGFDAPYDGMDWVSLRLVFVQKNGEWYLVGIVHDQWTI